MEQRNNNQEIKILMGNEAIVEGALASGVQFVAAYPGTPSSEIGNIFSRIGKQNNVYFEFSTNEKTALEAVVGASFSGLRCLSAMKNFGLNVACDALLPFVYTGSKGPAVIIVADDPSCHSSAQSEENSRAFAYLAHIPVLEPSDSQECYDFTQLAFQISEKFQIPVMVRTTTRVAHQRSIVELKVQNEKLKVNKGEFIKEPRKFLTMPPRVLEMHRELLVKIESIREFLEKSEINKIIQNPKVKILRQGHSDESFCDEPLRAVEPLGRSPQDGEPSRTIQKLGIIASGVSYLYAMETLQELQVDIPVLKIGLFYPLPENKIKNFIKPLKSILIVEELEPYLEKEVKILAKEVNPKLQVLGKYVLPEVGELSPDIVLEAVAKLAGKKIILAKPPELQKVKHLPRFCTTPTCLYWSLFAAVKQAIPQEEFANTVFGGDIGCYMLAALPPHNIYDYMLCMGSSIGIGHGISKATQGGQKPIVFIGDSTFFHSGVPALINVVYNKSNILVIVGDNRITAMTGHQPNPGMGLTGAGEVSPEIKIEDIVQALQIKNWKVLDPVENFNELVQTIKEFHQADGVSVIVARRMCALLEKKSSS